jgi:DNA-binding MarR family transcriptional regulator
MPTAEHMDLSVSQQRVLSAYKDITEKERRPPTYREVAEEVGVTRTAIVKAVSILERKGYIVRRPGQRNIVLTDKAQ